MTRWMISQNTHNSHCTCTHRAPVEAEAGLRAAGAAGGRTLLLLLVTRAGRGIQKAIVLVHYPPRAHSSPPPRREADKAYPRPTEPAGRVQAQTRGGRAGGGRGRGGEGVSVQQSGGCVHEGRARLVLLELSPEDEHSVPARVRGQLLHVAHRLEPLRTPALRDDDVDLEPVADLRGGRQHCRIRRSHNKAARGVSRWSGGEGQGREEKRDAPRCGAPSRS